MPIAPTATLSRPLRSGKGRAAWKVRPRPSRARRAGERPVTSTPSSETVPESGAWKPLRTLTSVVLPAPLGPISPSASPGSSARSTSFSTRSPAKAREMPSARRAPLGRSIDRPASPATASPAPAVAPERSGPAAAARTARRPPGRRSTRSASRSSSPAGSGRGRSRRGRALRRSRSRRRGWRRSRPRAAARSPSAIAIAPITAPKTLRAPPTTSIVIVVTVAPK